MFLHSCCSFRDLSCDFADVGMDRSSVIPEENTNAASCYVAGDRWCIINVLFFKIVI